MTSSTLLGAGAVPLIAGIVQILKSAGVPTRLAPLTALALGLAAGLVSVWQTGTGQTSWAAAVVLGISWGLAASGLYQSGKLARAVLKPASSPYAAPGSVPPAKAKPATGQPTTANASQDNKPA